MATIVSRRSGSIRGVEGGVEKILASIKEKSEKINNSPLLQRLRDVGTNYRAGLRCMEPLLVSRSSQLFMQQRSQILQLTHNFKICNTRKRCQTKKQERKARLWSM